MPVFLTGETGFGAEYDNNFAMVNVGGGYRGVLRCASGQSGLFAQVSIASTPAPPVMPVSWELACLYCFYQGVEMSIIMLF